MVVEIEQAVELGVVCPNCLGNGGPWPENPSMCGGMPCPVCNGVCQVCYGDWPLAIFLAGMDAYNDWLKEDETWEEVGGTPGYVGIETARRFRDTWKEEINGWQH